MAISRVDSGRNTRHEGDVLASRVYLQEVVLRRDKVQNFGQTEHFRITRDFLNRYPAMLKTLLADSDSESDVR